MLDEHKINPIKCVRFHYNITLYVKIALQILNKQISTINRKYVMSNNNNYLPFIKYNKM